MSLFESILEGLTPTERLRLRRQRTTSAARIHDLAWGEDLEEIDPWLRENRSEVQIGNDLRLNLAVPIVQYVSRKFWKQHRWKRDTIPSAVKDSWALCLLGRLAFTAAQVAAKESSERSNRMARDTRTVLLSYPGLARLWMVQARNWSVFVNEFLNHATEFRRNHRAGGLRSIEPDLSDLHSGNRAVVGVRLSDGSTWFYKPRSGRQEFGWYRFLHKLNRAGFPLPFKVLQVFSRKNYCWIEGVTHCGCRNKDDTAKYYFRAGALLYLIHRLKGADFHAGNLVAHRDQPVFIDCETLLHPVTPMTKPFENNGWQILRTGIVPFGPTGNDLSALGCTGPGTHSVRLRGKTVDYRDNAGPILAGFCEMHSFLRRRGKEGLFEKFVASLARTETRHVLRPSLYYWNTLQQSLAPDVLTDGLRRSNLLREACAGGQVKQRDVDAEVAAMEGADIPFFYGRTTPALPATDSTFDQALLYLKKFL